MKKRVIVVSIGAFILLALMLFIAKPSEVWGGIRKIGADYILLIISLYMINLIVKALRWKMMMASTGEQINFGSLLPIFVVGMALNNVTPGRIAGDPVRALIVSHRRKIEPGKCIAAVFAEKTLDLVFLVLLSGIGFAILVPSLTGDFIFRILLALCIITVILVLALVLIFNPGVVDRIINILGKNEGGSAGKNRIKELFEKGSKFAHQLNDALRKIMGDRSRGLFSIFITMAIWANEALRLYLIMRALGESVSLGGVLLVSNMATLIGMALPWGAANAATITAIFSSMGIVVENATTAGLLAVMTSIWLSVPLGAIILLVTGGGMVRKAMSRNSNDS